MSICIAQQFQNRLKAARRAEKIVSSIDAGVLCWFLILKSRMRAANGIKVETIARSRFPAHSRRFEPFHETFLARCSGRTPRDWEKTFSNEMEIFMNCKQQRIIITQRRGLWLTYILLKSKRVRKDSVTQLRLSSEMIQIKHQNILSMELSMDELESAYHWIYELWLEMWCKNLCLCHT